MAEDPKQKGWSDEKEIRIKVSPRSFLKKISLLVVLLMVFYLGRCSAPSGSGENTGTDTSSFSISGFITALLADDSTESPTTTAAQQDTGGTASQASAQGSNASAASAGDGATGAAVGESGESTGQASGDAAAAGSSEEEEEPLITSYSKVAIALLGVSKEWKETWGKIKQLKITIRNGEDGRIETDHIIMTVEGYEDDAMRKKIPLKQEFAGGKSYQLTVPVPGGFAYSQGTAGSLENVRISLVLFDSSGRAMASYSKETDLRGSS